MTNIELLKDKKFAPKNLGNLMIAGLGVSGQAVADFACKLLGDRLNSLTIYAGAYSDNAKFFADKCAQYGATVIFDDEKPTGSYDLCVVSPGISENSDFYKNAALVSTEVISEIELAWRESASDSTWVGITGTNGKTTITSVVQHIFASAGKNSCAVGNIGEAAISVVSSGSFNTYVAELSSYQLASCVQFCPDIAILSNITPDHLAWHGSFKAYADAKFSMHKRMLCADNKKIIINIEDESIASYIKDSDAFRGLSEGAGKICLLDTTGLSGVDVEDVEDGTNTGRKIPADDGHRCDVVRANEESINMVCGVNKSVECAKNEPQQQEILCRLADISLAGEHNVSNVMLASAAAYYAKIPTNEIAGAIATFKALEHRIEPCGLIDGVSFYNDSKATNTDAAICALNAFPGMPLIVLVGGYDKGTSLDDFVNQVAKVGCKVICFGKAGPRFYKAFKDALVDAFLVDVMKDAVDYAVKVAKRGDVILLSPACASFDEFNSFEHRGEVFKSMVLELDQKGSDNV